MQAIRTKYVGPTNTRPARIYAKCDAGSYRKVYDDGVSLEENHREACLLLRHKLGWLVKHGYPPMIGGDFLGDTYWVFLPRT